MPTNWQKTAKNSIKGQLKTHQKCKQKFAYNKIKSSQKHNQQACKINKKQKSQIILYTVWGYIMSKIIMKKFSNIYFLKC